MFPSTTTLLCAAISLPLLTAAQYSATYLPSNVPNQTEPGQAGTNQCGTGNDPGSQCQNAYLNGLTDFCLWGPPQPGPGSSIGNIERIGVSYCLASGYGTRLIPAGAITGAHFVQTPDYVQITGVGDLTTINIPAGDAGGEFDPHGADGNGNPVGGLVFSNAFGSIAQMHEWTLFISSNEFCFRACKDGPNAARLCEHIYDILGCEWNIPANYNPGVFEACLGDTATPMGVYGTSTFHQGDPATPPPHPAPSSSSCTTIATLTGSALAAPSSSRGTITPAPSSSARTSATAAASTTPRSSSARSATTSTSAAQQLAMAGWQRLVLCLGSVVVGCVVGVGLTL